jgi:hypothetical protein
VRIIRSCQRPGKLFPVLGRPCLAPSGQSVSAGPTVIHFLGVGHGAFPFVRGHVLSSRREKGTSNFPGREGGCPSRAGDRIRTGDVQLGNAAVHRPNPLPAITSGTKARRLAPQLAPVIENTPPAAFPTDLARVAAAWPALPDPIRRAVLALVESAAPASSR